MTLKYSCDSYYIVMSQHPNKRNTVLNIRTNLKNINATKPQPNRIVLKCFAISENVAHIVEPREKPGNSASHQAPNYVHVQRPKILQNMVKLRQNFN